MAKARDVYLPEQFLLQTGVNANPLKQLRRVSEQLASVEVQPFSRRAVAGERFTHPDGRRIAVLPRKLSLPEDIDEAFIFPTGKFPASASEFQDVARGARWIRPLATSKNEKPTQARTRCKSVLDSLIGQFHLKEERFNADGSSASDGLRPPQVGAIYASLSHWTITTEPATVVMPTGTGKTETMLALYARERFTKLLVVVPSNPLREQIGNKFLSFGVLRKFGVVGSGAVNPVVCFLRHKPGSKTEVEELIRSSNVIVTTMAIAGSLETSILAAFAVGVSHLIIDEAHHVSAPTWTRCRDAFKGKPVLQFTATPFRGDGKHVDGKPIFNYPLKKAQAEGYFKRIIFKPVTAHDRSSADKAIAQLAIAQLEQDLAAGFDHLIMARTAGIPKAKELAELYRSLGAKHVPLIIHNELPDSERRAALQALNSRKCRVIVCVDMLGEGFDLPELKIAALHDMHKSLAVTLQFTGRFTRFKSSLGEATMIANIADAEVEESLRELYAEDADWNLVLRQLSEGATGKQAKRSEFLSHFVGVGTDIPVQNITPAMSTVVFRTYQQSWNPERFKNLFKEAELPREPGFNYKDRVLVFIARKLEDVKWGDLRDIQNVTWHLYVLFWDVEQKLLFINSSNNDNLHEELAQEVCGTDVKIVRGEDVFRRLHGMRRILLTNLGLNHSLSRAVKFTWYVGSDIADGLSQAHLANKSKSNLFGRGYKAGELESIGCSRKGRVWSQQTAGDIQQWVEWCRATGAKLIDSNITFHQDILPHVIKPISLEERPAQLPLVIEWSEHFQVGKEDAVKVEFPGKTVTLLDVGFELVEPALTGNIRFRFFTDSESVVYEVVFSGKAEQAKVDYRPVTPTQVFMTIGRKRASISDWFKNEPPIIRFVSGDFLIFNELCPVVVHHRQPFAKNRIAAWDWTGVNLRKESQTYKKLTDSIQYKVLLEVLGSTAPFFDVVIDDDDSRESADIVAMAVGEETLTIHLYHCKYSKRDVAGARVEDMYEVCGQAQRSVYWKGDVEYLLTHLAQRDAGRLKKHNVSRFERGDPKALLKLKRRLHTLKVEFRIFIVQPGLSRGDADDSTLDLLAATELYLQETFGIPMEVIASE